MSSMIEYIRQINQNSVSIKPEWLDRLRYVDAGPDTLVLSPEIVLTGKQTIPGFTEGEYEAPVTPVTLVASKKHTAHTGHTPHAASATATNTRQTSPAPASMPPSQPDPPQINGIQVMSATGVQELGSQLYEQYSNRIDTGTGAEAPPARVGTPADGDARTNPEPLAPAAASPRPTRAAAAAIPVNRVAAPVPTTETAPVTEPETATEPATGAEPVVRAEPAPEPATAGEPVLVKKPASLLETPAVLTDIVRPTIMPLHQRTETGVPGAGPNDTRPLAPTDLEVKPAAGATLAPPSQIVQIIEGLEGTAFGDISDNDTIPVAEWPLQTDAEPQADQEPGIPAEPAPQTDIVPQTLGADPPAERVTAATAASDAKRVTFPTDKRGERFHYARSKKQNLVNAIVDQVVERFPSRAPASILFVGASREIDVDSAASRIATCLATREIGDILLVDANLRNRQLTTVLGMEGDAGIADAFPDNEPAIQLVSETDNARLKVLAAGTRDLSSEATTLPSSNVTNNSLRQEFQYTIISGGVAGDKLTDAWSGLVDGVYLIVDMEESDRNGTVAAVDYFRKLGARIVGCIATRT